MRERCVLCLVCLLTVTAGQPRRGAGRHRGHQPQPLTETAGEFLFSTRLAGGPACWPGRSNRAAVTRAVRIARSSLAGVAGRGAELHCRGSSLSSLPSPHPAPAPATPAQLHLHIISILSHLFFLRLDWMTGRGLPCLPAPALANLAAAQLSLLQAWQTLLCEWLGWVELPAEVVAANLAVVRGVAVHRYSDCRQRAVRDCVLASQANSLLHALDGFLSSVS